jgi:5'-3' exonuclease
VRPVLLQAGSDFLPAVPFLELQKGGMGLLIFHYKQHLEKGGGFLTIDGEVKADNLKAFFILLQEVEKNGLAANEVTPCQPL